MTEPMAKVLWVPWDEAELSREVWDAANLPGKEARSRASSQFWEDPEASLVRLPLTLERLAGDWKRPHELWSDVCVVDSNDQLQFQASALVDNSEVMRTVTSCITCIWLYLNRDGPGCELIVEKKSELSGGAPKDAAAAPHSVRAAEKSTTASTGGGEHRASGVSDEIDNGPQIDPTHRWWKPWENIFVGSAPSVVVAKDAKTTAGNTAQQNRSSLPKSRIPSNTYGKYAVRVRDEVWKRSSNAEEVEIDRKIGRKTSRSFGKTFL